MTTAEQLIAYLQTLPKNTQIQVVKEVSGDYWTSTSWVDLELDNHTYLGTGPTGIPWLELGEK